MGLQPVDLFVTAKFPPNNSNPYEVEPKFISEWNRIKAIYF